MNRVYRNLRISTPYLALISSLLVDGTVCIQSRDHLVLSFIWQNFFSTIHAKLRSFCERIMHYATCINYVCQGTTIGYFTDIKIPPPFTLRPPD